MTQGMIARRRASEASAQLHLYDHALKQIKQGNVIPAIEYLLRNSKPIMR